MTTQLSEAMTCGMFVEFIDEAGHCAGHMVFVDWQGRPVPGTGDAFSCAVPVEGGAASRKLAGHVRERHFEVQRQEDGRPCVWVRITVDLGASPRARRDGSQRSAAPCVLFSRN